MERSQQKGNQKFRRRTRIVWCPKIRRRKSFTQSIAKGQILSDLLGKTELSLDSQFPLFRQMEQGE